MILLQEGEMTAQLVNWGGGRGESGKEIMRTDVVFFLQKKIPPFHKDGKENVFFVITRSITIIDPPYIIMCA